MQSCSQCKSTENLIESGGQFQGGVWLVCKTCDEAGQKFSEWMKSEEFLKLLKQQKEIR